jgi:hypothetical protein
MFHLAKPASWVLSLERLAPEALQLWRECSLALPLWDSGMRMAEDVGPYKLHGAFGTNLATTDWAGSEYGPVVVFGGNSSELITVADPAANYLDGCADLSVEILFRPTGVTGLQGLLGKYVPSTGGRGWRLYLNGANLAFQVSSDGANNEIQATTGTPISAGTWTHALVTYSSGTFACYVGGKAVATDGNFGTATSIFAAAQALIIGQRTAAGGGASDVYYGQVAGARVWQRALSAQEAQLLFEAPWAMYDPGILFPGPGYALAYDSGSAELLAGATLLVGGAADRLSGARIRTGATGDLLSGCGLQGTAPVLTYPVKPAPAGIDLSRLAPEAAELWRDCRLAYPLWSAGSRTAEDLSPSRLHGAFGSALLSTDWVGTPYGLGLQFSGSSGDVVTVADPSSNLLDGCGDLSVEVLFRPSSVTGLHGLVGKYQPAVGQRSWRLYQNGTELELQVSSDGTAYEIQTTTAAALTVDSWHQAVVTFRAGVFRVYVQGKAVAVDADFTLTTIYGGAQELKIGQRTAAAGGASDLFLGQIASVRVWQRALAADEALRLHEDPWGMYTTGRRRRERGETWGRCSLERRGS